MKNSQHLADELAELIIEEEDILNLHDVVSLFTNTPIDQVLEIVKRRLQSEDLLKVYNKEEGFNLTSDDIVELLNFILTTTYIVLRLQGQNISTAIRYRDGQSSISHSCQHFYGIPRATSDRDSTPEL